MRRDTLPSCRFPRTRVTPSQPGAGARRRSRLGTTLALAATVLAADAPIAAAQETHKNTELLGQYRVRGGKTNYNDVWGYTAPDGTEIAILGVQEGIAFVDVTDPRRPAEVAFFFLPPTTHRDMRTYDHYAYAVNETSGGLAIFDLADPRHPVHVGDWNATFDSAHNLGIYDGFAYAVGTRQEVPGAGRVERGTRILDLADPMNPVEVGAWTPRYVHDIWVHADIAYMSTIRDGGFAIVNVRDKTNPREFGFARYAEAHTHNAWGTADGNVLLTTDETGGGHLRVWDTSNPGAPVRIAEWTASPAAIVHNVLVRGDSAYVSYYTEGLQVLDIRDPRQPQRVAWYDTWPGLSGGFDGAWGVYVFERSGNVLVSDRASGLFVIRLVPTTAQPEFAVLPPDLQTAHPGDRQLFYAFEIQNAAAVGQTFQLAATSTPAWTLDVPLQVRLPPQSSDVVTVTVQVPATLAADTAVDVNLCATSVERGFTRCAHTTSPTPVILEAFTASVQGAADVVLRWRLHREPGDAGHLLVLRAPAGDAPTLPTGHKDWQERARLPLEARGFVDPGAAAGAPWDYALAWETASGTPRLLGTRRVEANPAGRVAAPVLRLHGASPNPFNPRTRIVFDLTRPGSVRLQVFDLHGRLLDERVRHALGAGTHAIPWDARDRHGRALPSGVYPFRVTSGSWVERGRLVLVR